MVSYACLVMHDIGALAMLKDSSTLRTLSLTLRSPKGSKIGDAGAQALAMKTPWVS